MIKWWRRFLLVEIFLSGTVLAVMAVAVIFNLLFLGIPWSSPENYDCDDAALQTMDRFAVIGVNAIPVLGNIGMTGEKFSEIDHAWVVVELPFNKAIAFDWGLPNMGRQHYEYYPISRSRLLQFVNQDFINNGIPVPAGAK